MVQSEKVHVTPSDSLRSRGSLLRHDLYTLISESSPGRLLPSERFLCRKYNVSRNTVAKVLRLLAAEGLVERQHGRGTLVKGKAVITFLLPCPDFLSSSANSGDCIIRERLRGAVMAAQERNLGFEMIAVSPVNNRDRVEYSLLSRINAGSMVIVDEWFRMLFPLLADRRARVALLSKGVVPYGYAQYTKSWHHLVLNSAQSVENGMKYLMAAGCQRIALTGGWINEPHHPLGSTYRQTVQNLGMKERLFELPVSGNALSVPPRDGIKAFFDADPFDGLLLGNGCFGTIPLIPFAENVQQYLGIPETVKVCGVDQHLPQMPFARQFPFFRAPDEQIGYDAVALLADNPGGQRQDKFYECIFEPGEKESKEQQ